MAIALLIYVFRAIHKAREDRKRPDKAWLSLVVLSALLLMALGITLLVRRWIIAS